MDENRRSRRQVADSEPQAPDGKKDRKGKVTIKINLLKLWKFIALVACVLAVLFCLLWIQERQSVPEETDITQNPAIMDDQPVETQPAQESTVDPEAFDVSGVSIEGKRIIIDPGHGGDVPGGTTGVSGKKEKDVNLEISMRLKQMLEENGAAVIMTRESDVSLSPSNNWEEDMQARERIILDSNADMFISIHQNEFENPEAKGPQVFFVKQGSIGKRLAVCIQDMMNYELDIENPRIALEAAYRVLKTGEQPSCTVECGFMSNPEEDLLLQDGEYQDKVAKSIMDGIKLYVKQFG